LVAIYSHHGQLYVTWGEAGVPFKSIDIEYSSVGKRKRRLVFRQASTMLFATEYTVTRLQFSNDMTPHVEAEHFDFGLLLNHLSTDAARVERLAAM
jgi:hypothetical protein